MALLSVKNLNIGFNFLDGYAQAVHDVGFELKKGETLAIVGESGSGKTLSCMSVLNLLPENSVVTGGIVEFEGENLLKLPQKSMQKIRGRKIALIPQDPMTSLDPLYTIGDQLLEVIEIHQGKKGKEAREIAIQALERVKIPDASEKLKAYPHEFSGGMKQRVVIAIALACKARIIIADEPTTALDVTVQAQIMEILREIKEKYGISIILITHDMGIVAQNADKIAVMYAGHIVEAASKAELFKNPKHPYTKALLKVILDINSDKIETIDGQPPSITDKITGCPFAPRCASRMEICTKIYPKTTYFADNSTVQCHLYNEINQ